MPINATGHMTEVCTGKGIQEGLVNGAGVGGGRSGGENVVRILLD